MNATPVLDIELTEFCTERLFDPSKAGTTIMDRTPAEFEGEIHANWEQYFWRDQDGYAPFCRLVFMRNWIDSIKAGTLSIVRDNQHLLRSEYSARRDDELPVLTRWIETDNVPRAEYLVLVLYSKEQIEKEARDKDEPIDFESDWGVVAVLGQVGDSEEPMQPVTMMRNALGTAEGGSGALLDREAYQRSVEFWNAHAVVKSPLTYIG